MASDFGNTHWYEAGDVVLTWLDTSEPDANGNVELIGPEVLRVVGRHPLLSHMYNVKSLFSSEVRSGWLSFNSRKLTHIKGDDSADSIES